MEDVSDRKQKTERIAQLNDEFRRRMGTSPNIPGAVFITAGIDALAEETQIFIRLLVREHSAFEPGNDPYGEHDFGAFDVPGAGKVFWKIDYLGDASMQSGAEDPSDPTRSFRVLTIMLASEY